MLVGIGAKGSAVFAQTAPGNSFTQMIEANGYYYAKMLWSLIGRICKIVRCSTVGAFLVFRFWLSSLSLLGKLGENLGRFNL